MIRHYLSVPLLLVASRLLAQAPTIAPAPSVLFHLASVAPARDSIKTDVGTRQRTGSIIGFLAGAGLGFWIVAGSQGGCEETTAGGGGGGCGSSAATMPRVIGTIVGGLAGIMIGSIIAGPDSPSPQ